MPNIWTLVRIAGIIVGVATLLRLATITGAVEYNAVFQAWMDRVRDLVELGGLTDVLETWAVQPALELLRGLGLPIPQLQPHWQSVFILSWLMLGAMAKSVPHYIGPIFQISAAFTSALFGGIIAGILPAQSFGLLYGFIIALLLFAITPALLTGRCSSAKNTFESLLLLLPIIFLDLLISQQQPHSFGSIQEFTLPFLVILVTGFGIVYLVIGLRSPGSYPARVSNPETQSGLDILFVLGLALGIGYVMMR